MAVHRLITHKYFMEKLYFLRIPCIIRIKFHYFCLFALCCRSSFKSFLSKLGHSGGEAIKDFEKEDTDTTLNVS